MEDVDQLHWLELPGNIATDDSLLPVKPQILQTASYVFRSFIMSYDGRAKFDNFKVRQSNSSAVLNRLSYGNDK